MIRGLAVLACLGVFPVVGSTQTFDAWYYPFYTEGIGASSTHSGAGFGNRAISGGSELDIYLFDTQQSQSMTAGAAQLSGCQFSTGKARKKGPTVERIVGEGQLPGGQPHAIVLGYGIVVVSGKFLNDGGAYRSTALGTDGTAIVGSTSDSQSAPPKAVFWANPDEAPIFLPAFGPSEAYGVDSDFIVGNSAPNSSQHATVWNRINVDPIDINPNGFNSSALYGISDQAGGHQTVGWGFNSLNVATGFIGNYNGSSWITTALPKPTGFSETFLYDTDGTSQVGSGRAISGNRQHALLWTGGSFDPIDLQQFTTGMLSTEARHIDEKGNIFGFGLTTGFQRVGIAWMVHPVPEPSTAACWAFGLLASAKKGRTKRKAT